MQGPAAYAVAQLDAERTGRGFIVGFLREETDRGLDERVERFLGGEIPRIARHTRPVERGGIHGVVARAALHQSELAAHIIADMPELLHVVRPGQHVEMGPDGLKTERVRLVEILVDPLLVYLVPAGVAGKGLHVTRTFLEHTQVFVAVFQEHVLVVKVVAGKQKPHGGREREQAVRTVGGKTLVTGVRTHAPRQVFRVRERVQAHPFVAHAQNLGPQLDVLKRSRLREREGKVPLQQARTIRRTRDLVPREADKGQETRIVQNTLELFRRLQEFCRRFPVYLFGNDVAPAEGREV
ncbi:hypothetical protein BACCOP_00929 [Phocaeicola coprocola DSM 17136]|uniref:Uncharacterized protein n=1 Tax=Phocaeicola coprocola DSM 17136 TaxID=470145 RepID=B3JGC7_9BACT|nr:hypothetical protein BACCOP_00929 [Phocaeicola coprocola DSM 17136]